jgi:aldose 1-epimerase
LFSHTSPAGDQGFPGVLTIEVIFALSNPARTWDPVTFERQLGSAIIVYRAVVRDEKDAEKKIVTPVNLTHHWGFNLDASYAKPLGDTPDVLGHKLFIDSEKIIKSDEAQLPMGDLEDIAGTRFDFRDERTIGSQYAKGYGLHPCDRSARSCADGNVLQITTISFRHRRPASRPTRQLRA